VTLRGAEAPAPLGIGARMTLGRKVLIVVTAVLGLVVAGAVLYLGPIAPIATGYAAKIVCSGHFVADRSVEDVERDLPDNPLVPLLRVQADGSEGTVRALLLGAWPSTADVTPGLVCSSYLYATARDRARFGQWYLQDGEWGGEPLLPEGWVGRSTTPVDLPVDDPYGAQWWLNEGADGDLRMPGVPADAYWASGNEGQQVVVIPSEDLVVVRLGFSGQFSGVEWGLEPMLVGIIAATG
jgi:CubicO group peptidase (beta-lactamase class C family)